MDMNTVVKGLSEFQSNVNDDNCLGIEGIQRPTDREASEMIKSLYKITSGHELQKFIKK